MATKIFESYASAVDASYEGAARTAVAKAAGQNVRHAVNVRLGPGRGEYSTLYPNFTKADGDAGLVPNALVAQTVGNIGDWKDGLDREAFTALVGELSGKGRTGRRRRGATAPNSTSTAEAWASRSSPSSRGRSAGNIRRGPSQATASG